MLFRAALTSLAASWLVVDLSFSDSVSSCGSDTFADINLPLPPFSSLNSIGSQPWWASYLTSHLCTPYFEDDTARRWLGLARPLCKLRCVRGNERLSQHPYLSQDG